MADHLAACYAWGASWSSSIGSERERKGVQASAHSNCCTGAPGRLGPMRSQATRRRSSIALRMKGAPALQALHLGCRKTRSGRPSLNEGFLGSLPTGTRRKLGRVGTSNEMAKGRTLASVSGSGHHLNVTIRSHGYDLRLCLPCAPRLVRVANITGRGPTSARMRPVRFTEIT